MIGYYLKSKLHLATITEANSAYEGSVTIDRTLLDAVGLLTYEQVHLWDVTNGERIVTYVLAGEPDSGLICVNGAGAKLMSCGEKIIIASFCQLTPEEARSHSPRQVLLDANNRIDRVLRAGDLCR